MFLFVQFQEYLAGVTLNLETQSYKTRTLYTNIEIMKHLELITRLIVPL